MYATTVNYYKQMVICGYVSERKCEKIIVTGTSTGSLPLGEYGDSVNNTCVYGHRTPDGDDEFVTECSETGIWTNIKSCSRKYFSEFSCINTPVLVLNDLF